MSTTRFFSQATGGPNYVVLGSDFSTTNPTGVVVPGMSFTPAANKTYRIEGIAILIAGTAADAARAGVSFPTGTSYQAGKLESVATTSTTSSSRYFGSSALQMAANSATPDNTNHWPCVIDAVFRTGGSPSGDFALNISNEMSGSTTTIKAGSFFTWREI